MTVVRTVGNQDERCGSGMIARWHGLAYPTCSVAGGLDLTVANGMECVRDREEWLPVVDNNILLLFFRRLIKIVPVVLHLVEASRSSTSILSHPSRHHTLETLTLPSPQLCSHPVCAVAFYGDPMVGRSYRHRSIGVASMLPRAGPERVKRQPFLIH